MNTVSTEESSDTEVQWDTYAIYYDELCSNNPAYQDMIKLVVDRVILLLESPSPAIIDVGAGTGTLLNRLLKVLPSASCIHLDNDRGMNVRAEQKYNADSQNVVVMERSALEVEIEENQFDLILSTNAIYAIEPHAVLLNRFRTWLKPDGHLVLVDFGRPQNVNDWVWYLFKESFKSNGLVSTVKFFNDNWEAARQNKRTQAAQEQGNYWVHDTKEFGSALEEAGFYVEELGSCYRDYSDIAVCRLIPT